MKESGPFYDLVKGDAEQVIPDGLQFGMKAGNIDGRTVGTGGVRGEQLIEQLMPRNPASPATRGIKHTR